MKQLSLVSTPPPQTAYERARAEEEAHIRHVLTEALGWVCYLEQIARSPFATVCVAHDAPICADRLSADIARMLASLKNGRIR